LKRAFAGTLPLIPAAMKLADEVLAGASPDETPEGPLQAEERAVAQGKKIFLLAAGGAVQRFRDQLGEQQEIMAALANCAMEIYAMESSLRRAQKAAARGNSAAASMADAARAFIYDAADRLEKEARTALSATLEGDMLQTQLAVLRRFAKKDAVDTIAIRRRIADAVLAQDRYPFEGR